MKPRVHFLGTVWVCDWLGTRRIFVRATVAESWQAAIDWALHLLATPITSHNKYLHLEVPEEDSELWN